MDLRRHDRLAMQRPIGAGHDRNVTDPGHAAHATSVERGLLERLVAGDDRDPLQLECRRGGGKQDGNRIVVARVTVEDDAPTRRRHSLM